MTTATFEEKGGKTLLTFHELHPSTAPLEEALVMEEPMAEQSEQLDELLAALGANAGGA